MWQSGYAMIRIIVEDLCNPDMDFARFELSRLDRDIIP